MILRPFQIRVEMDKNTFETTHCREHYLFLLEYFQQFVEVYKDEQQKFTMTWISELTHNWLSPLHHADDSIHLLLLEMQSQLEDSFLVIMGDHGLRFGGARYTPTGTTEDNNPALFFVLPRKLRRNYKLRAIMQENARQLISHHDLYATFLTIARSQKWDGTDWDSKWNAEEYPEALHGSSLFHKLIKQPRDCPTLSIPFAYCQCDKKYVEIKASPENNELINQLAAASVSKVNKDIKKTKYNDKCATLSPDDAKYSVNKIEKLEMATGNDASNQEENKLIVGTFLIKIFKQNLVEVNSQDFLEPIVIRNKREAAAVKRVSSIEFISDQFERLNSHGDQSQCAASQLQIRPYCYCNDYKPVKTS